MAEVGTHLANLPYKLACICDLVDDKGRHLLLHRKKAPNLGLFSPIGGKLDVHTGESPAQCAQREIHEEVGLDLPLERLHLLGMVAETAFEGKGHWLMFVYQVLGTVWVEPHDMREGRLDWYTREEMMKLDIPETDRKVILPLMRKAERQTANGKPGFFSVHIDCRETEMKWTIDQLMPGS